MKNCIACTIIKPGGTALLSHVIQNRRKDLHIQARPETHTKRQAIKHDCLPSLLGDGDNLFKIMHGIKNVFLLRRLDAAKAGQKSLVYWHIKPNEPTKEGPLAFVLVESPFVSASTVSSGHPSLVSLGLWRYLPRYISKERGSGNEGPPDPQRYILLSAGRQGEANEKTQLALLIVSFISILFILYTTSLYFLTDSCLSLSKGDAYFLYLQPFLAFSFYVQRWLCMRLL